MEPNQTIPSPDNSWIPQGIPTGVFVPNNQVPVQTQVSTTQIPVETPVQQPSIQTTTAPIMAKEGPLDKIFRWLARFFAKITGQPDPITGTPNVASQTAKKTENIVGKVRDVANQAVAKASNVASKAVDTVNQATEQVQKIIPPTSKTAVSEASPQPTQPIQLDQLDQSVPKSQ